MDRQELAKLIQTGVAFKVLLSSSTFSDGINEARDRLHEQIEATSEDDTATREHCYTMLRTLMLISNSMSGSVSEGIAAEMELENMDTGEDE